MEPDPLAARAGDRAACGHARCDNGQIRPGQREEVRVRGRKIRPLLRRRKERVFSGRRRRPLLGLQA